MELKLQQAIVATRAGRTDVAQSLLTQLIRENPDDANAWFLLGTIVDTPERQALYLHKTIELEPEHTIAKQRLVQLEKRSIPAPVIQNQTTQNAMLESNGEGSPPDHSLVETVAETATLAELSEGLQDLNDTQPETQTTPDQAWPASAGQPVREKRESQAVLAVAPASQSSSPVEAKDDGSPGEVWLVRILVIMVIVAAIVLGILVLLILI